MKRKDPEAMLTKDDLMKLGKLQDGVALMEYGRAFHKLSKAKQDQVEKLAEKMFFGEKTPVFCGKCDHYNCTATGGYAPGSSEWVTKVECECVVPRKDCYDYRGYIKFDTYDPKEKNKNNDCKDFEAL